ncbi:MAG: hypothetical protein ACXAC2_19450 [Candidatus Kariarchaeaceae archaeon]|jgi:hypothetical protein
MVNIQTPNLNEKHLQVTDSKKETSMGTYERVSNFVDSRSTKTMIGTILLSFIAFMHANIWLGILFEKTGYPVPLLESQNRFSASGLKSDFAVLVENGTLNDYKIIQYLDLYIMITTAICFGTIALAMSRKISHDSPWRKRGFKLALLFPLSSVLDFVENIVLLIMLENPVEFPNWMAYLYSALALSKLMVFIVGILSVVVISVLARNDR